jgi:hypothetical protein
MYDTQKDLLDGFRSAPDIFKSLLEGVSQEQAQAARGGDEDWSIVEVVCHLRDAEERALERMRAMRDQDEPFLPGYDQEAWARERNYAAQDVHEALQGYLRLKEQHIAELEALTPEQWGRPGMHEEQGRITISDHTLHLVAHDSQHAAQIARQLKG